MVISASSVPIEVARQKGEALSPDRGTGLFIRWSTGEETSFSSAQLRRHCPCAACVDRAAREAANPKKSAGRAALKVISASADESYDLQEVWAIGSYAIGLRWADGHDTGIYTYRLLRELAAQGGAG